MVLGIAARQHGVIDTAGLRSAGLSKDVVQRCVRSGLLYPVYAGVFAVGRPELSESGRLFAAFLAYGEGALIARRSAAAHYGAIKHGPRRIEVLAPTGTERAGTRLHRGRVREGQATVRDGVPVTSVGRTLADMATDVLLEQVVHAMQVKRLLDAAQIRIALHAVRNRPGAARLRALLAEIDPDVVIRSELERLFVALLRSSPLLFPEINPLVEMDGRMWQPDAIWFDQRVLVELDGDRFHRTALARKEDARKDEAFFAAGYVVLRFTWDDVTKRSGMVLEAIEAALRTPVIL